MVKVIRRINAGLLVFLAVYFLLVPGCKVVRYLLDDAIRQAGMPRMAWEVFKAITPAYEKWARERLVSGRAEALSLQDISGTEWPLFGSVFYLWAVERLQQDWQQAPGGYKCNPIEFARGAIDAASRLVVDPSQAAWVIQHWGTNYLHHENVFYRALVMAALTSRQKLLGDDWNQELLRDQVESLARELDESAHGVLDDYPNQCYPGDVLAAIHIIHEAGPVLGTNHTAFVQRARRGFQGRLLDRRGLPPYDADAAAGIAYEPARGCGLSYMLFTSPHIWPDLAAEWFNRYEKYFWQNQGLVHGFREFPSDLPGFNWHMDVDAGPVLGGVGVSASAFGVAASRTMGRFDKAYPLTAELMVSSWPLPDNRLMVPRLLSNAADAPLLGEACILFNLACQPAAGFPAQAATHALPLFVYLALALYFGLGFLFSAAGIIQFCRPCFSAPIRLPRVQYILWSALVAAGIGLAAFISMLAAALPLFTALLLPRD